MVGLPVLGLALEREIQASTSNGAGEGNFHVALIAPITVP
jgi:hypothetical protein